MIQPLIQPRTCKMSSSILFAMSWIKFTIMTGSSFKIIPQIERTYVDTVFVARVNDYRGFPSIGFPTDPGAFPLEPSCMSHILGPPVWRQLWYQYNFTIIPGWGCHLLSPIHLSPDTPTPLICCGPGVLGVWCLHIEGKMQVVRGIGDCTSPHYYVLWQYIRVCG